MELWHSGESLSTLWKYIKVPCPYPSDNEYIYTLSFLFYCRFVFIYKAGTWFNVFHIPHLQVSLKANVCRWEQSARAPEVICDSNYSESWRFYFISSLKRSRGICRVGGIGVVLCIRPCNLTKISIHRKHFCLIVFLFCIFGERTSLIKFINTAYYYYCLSRGSITHWYACTDAGTHAGTSANRHWVINFNPPISNSFFLFSPFLLYLLLSLSVLL